MPNSTYARLQDLIGAPILPSYAAVRLTSDHVAAVPQGHRLLLLQLVESGGNPDDTVTLVNALANPTLTPFYDSAAASCLAALRATTATSNELTEALHDHSAPWLESYVTARQRGATPKQIRSWTQPGRNAFIGGVARALAHATTTELNAVIAEGLNLDDYTAMRAYDALDHADALNTLLRHHRKRTSR